MVTEDYVSFEIAKLLKEKGFNADIDLWYDKDGNIFDCYKYEITRNWRIKAQQEVYFCPTLQMAMKWLRESYNLQIQIAPITSKNKDWAFGIYRDFSPLTIDLLCFPTYEEACEAGIKYCLEILI